MNFFVNLFRIAKLYSAALFFGAWVLLGIFLTILKKGPRWFFAKKIRKSRPMCMQDSSLGSHGFLRTKDVRLHYVAAGPCNKPLMLMIHGFPENWYSWRYQIKEFKNDYRVVALDMRGYCESEVLPGAQNYVLSKLVDDIKETISALGYSSCVLVAHDWGGIVAWTFAMDYPDLVDKLICMNIPHIDRFLQHKASSWKQTMMSWYMLFFQLPILPELVLSAGDYRLVNVSYHGDDAGLKLHRENCTDDDIEAFKFGLSQPGSLTAALNYYRALNYYPQKPRHNSMVTSPSLLIWGDKDKAFDPAVLEGHDKFVKDFTLCKVPGASHFVQQDAALEVNEIMRGFLGGN